jgi:hypothetical protein
MAISQVTGTVTTGITLTSGVETNPFTIASTAALIGRGVSAATNWTIVNDGHVIAPRGTGVMLSAGGAVTNDVGAAVIAYTGIFVRGGTGSVVNAGEIFAYGRAGVDLRAGGSVTNLATGWVYSGYAGVYGSSIGPAISVDNMGSMKGFRFGVVFRDGGDVTNAAGAAITSIADTGVYAAGRRFNTITNAGAIAGYNTGVFLGISGGSVVNSSGASIRGGKKDGVLAWGTATVRNSGTIAGATDAIYFESTGANRLIVDAGAVFRGTVAAAPGGANVIELTSSAVAGTLSGIGSKYVGFQTVTIDSGAAWTVSGAKAGLAGVTLGGFGVNDAIDLTDVAYAAGETASVNAADVLTVTNAAGVALATVQLSGNFANCGFLVAGDKAAGIKITEFQLVSQIAGADGDGVVLTSATYTCPYTVTSTGAVTNSGNAIFAAQAWNVTNYGNVGSGAGMGINLAAGGSLANGGQISGATYGVFLTGAGSVRNSGTITGRKGSVYLKGAGSNRLIMDAGAVFMGSVKANASSANTIELTSTGRAGVLNGLGTKYLGFQTVTIDSAAAWTVSGSKAGLAGVSINGFNSRDVLVVSDVPYALGDTVSINASDLLTVANAGGAVVAAAQLSGDFTGVRFMIGANLAGGIKIWESTKAVSAKIMTPSADTGEAAGIYGSGATNVQIGVFGQFVAAGLAAAAHNAAGALASYSSLGMASVILASHQH